MNEGVSLAAGILVVLANVDDVDGDVGEDPDEEEDEPDHGLRVDRDCFQWGDESDDDCRNKSDGQVEAKGSLVSGS